MQRTKRYKDVHSAGKSKIVPLKKNEHWKDRHNRRKEVALRKKQIVQDWCNHNKFVMDVKNDGHHWLFRTPNNKSVQWFPSTGKLIIGEQWKQGIHLHDIYQLIEVLSICKKNEE